MHHLFGVRMILMRKIFSKRPLPSWKRRKDHANVRIQADGTHCDFPWRICLPIIYTNISCIRVFQGVSPKRILDDTRRVVSNTQFQKQNIALFVMP